MAWIESHTVLNRHRKVIDLASSLSIKPVYALGHLHALWHTALEQQEDGNLRNWSDAFLAKAADFEGDPKAFRKALEDIHWMDDGIIHDWLDYSGKWLISKYSTSKRSLLVTIWRLHGLRYGSRDSKSVYRRGNKRTESEQKANLPNLPNYTLPNQTKPKEIALSRTPPENPEVQERRTYRIPEPKEDPLGAVVMYYKAVRKSVPYDDRFWDKQHFARAAKSAKALLQICGSYEAARACMDQFAADMDGAGRSWTLETVVKWAHEWKVKNGGKDYGATNSARFLDAVAKQRSAGKFANLRKVSTAGEILAGARNLSAIRSGPEDDHGDARDPDEADLGAVRSDAVEAKAD